MKTHYDHPTFGVCCNTNKSRRTTHLARATQDATKVTCAICKKQHNIGNGEKR